MYLIILTKDSLQTLARFQMVVTIALSLYVPYQAISCEDYHNLIWIPFVIIGAYGVFREVRRPLFIYIILYIISGIALVLQVAVRDQYFPECTLGFSFS